MVLVVTKLGVPVEKLGRLLISGGAAKKLRWICRMTALIKITPLTMRTNAFLLVIGLIVG